MRKIFAALFMLLLMPTAWAAYPEYQTCSLAPHTHPGGVCNAYGGAVPSNVRSWAAGPPNSIVFGCSGGNGTSPSDGLTCSTAQSCPVGQVYNSATGHCEVPPAPTCPPMGTSKGAGTEAYVDRLSVNVCQGGCGFTAAGAMKAGGKYVAFGPFVATGETCAPSGGTGSNTTTPSIPDAQCSYRNPTTGACEASCPTGQTFREVPSGGSACVKPAIDPNPVPPDTSCPRGYINIAVTGVNCSPTGGLGNSVSSGVATCPAGQHSTSLNGGAAYCVFDGSDKSPLVETRSSSPATTTTNPDGSTTKTASNTVSNKDGSKTTTTTTTLVNSDGSEVVTTAKTTTKTPSGADGVDSPVNDKSDLCKLNPHLNICQNSTVSGSRSSVTCTGDAIQCATLQLHSKVFDDTPTPQSTLGGQVMTGNDPLKSTLPSATNASEIAMPSSLNSTGFLGSGACFPDQTFSFQGMSFTISFTEACKPLLAFRYAMFVLALLAALRVVGGSMIRS